MKDFIIILIIILLGALHLVPPITVIKTKDGEWGLLYILLFALDLSFGGEILYPYLFH